MDFFGISEIRFEQVIEQAVWIGVTIILGYVTWYLMRRLMKSLAHRKYLSEGASRILLGSTRLLIGLIVGILLLEQIGVHVVELWTTLSAVLVAVAVGFVALWSIFSNFLCALMLVLMRPFRIGDRIQLLPPGNPEGIKGTVVNLSAVYTTIEEEAEEGEEPCVVQVPNTLFFQHQIRRWSGKKTVELDSALFGKERPHVANGDAVIRKPERRPATVDSSDPAAGRGE